MDLSCKHWMASAHSMALRKLSVSCYAFCVINCMFVGVDRLDKDLTIGQMQGKCCDWVVKALYSDERLEIQTIFHMFLTHTYLYSLRVWDEMKHQILCANRNAFVKDAMAAEECCSCKILFKFHQQWVPACQSPKQLQPIRTLQLFCLKTLKSGHHVCPTS